LAAKAYVGAFLLAAHLIDTLASLYSGRGDGKARWDDFISESPLLEPLAFAGAVVLISEIFYLPASPSFSLWNSLDRLGAFRLNRTGPAEVAARD
jgi:hypothetical protein